MPSVLITGAGYVASGIAKRFLEADYDLVFLDISDSSWCSRVDFIRESGSQTTFVQGSVTDFNTILQIAKKHDVEGIIHTAIMGGQGFMEGSFQNVVATEYCLEVARRLNLKLVNISSVSTYGAAVSSGMLSATETLTEDDTVNKFALAPAGPYDMAPAMAHYACIKRIGEELVSMYHQLYDMHCCSFRLGEIYGYSMGILRFSNIMIRLALAGKPFEALHGADHPENCTYTLDVGTAAVNAFKKKPVHPVYNLTGTGAKIDNYLTLEQQAGVIAKVISGASLRIGPGMVPGGSYAVSYVRARISAERAEREIGYTITPYEQGIRETVGWMKKNWDMVPRRYFETLPPEWIAR